MTIKRRISKIEQKIKGGEHTDEEIEAERIAIDAAERKVQERLRRISRSRNESGKAHCGA